MAVEELPARVRERLIALAAARLTGMTDAEIPASLRRVRSFTPAKRARLGAVPLLAAVQTDRAFRAALTVGVRAVMPEVVVALDAGEEPPGDAVDAAVAAVLIDAPTAGALLEAIRAADDERASATAGRADAAELTRLRDELAGARADQAAAAAVHAVEVAALTASVAEARRRAKPVEAAARRATADAQGRVAEAEASLVGLRAEVAAAAGEVAALRLRAAAAEDALEAARRVARGDRSAEDARVRLLLDTLLAAGQGLRRALAPGVGELQRPGDALAAALAGAAPPAADARVVTDPAALDALLALPTVHLVVDGYNVTKTGYGGVTLEAQRSRLIGALAALAARTGAEVTVVFDGAGRPALAAPSRDPRGVRVAWSPAGVTADDIVLRFVDAEPAGRPVVVVSTDGEVVAGARRRGATPVTSATLLARLDRG